MKPSREDSFDIHGQVSYLLWKNLRNLRSTDKLPAYLTTITRRAIFALGERSKIIQKVEVALEEDELFTPAKQPDQIYEDIGRNEALMQWYSWVFWGARFPEKCR